MVNCNEQHALPDFFPFPWSEETRGLNVETAGTWPKERSLASLATNPPRRKSSNCCIRIPPDSPRAPENTHSKAQQAHSFNQEWHQEAAFPGPAVGQLQRRGGSEVQPMW